jgi:type IV secretion system protein VirB6
MGFFATFWAWLNGQLAGYVEDRFANLSTALEPTIVTLAVLYVMVWGYLQMTGRIEEPFVLGLKRILTVAIVLGVSLRMWLYNAVIVDTFYVAPAQLAAAITKAPDPVVILDRIWNHGGAVAGFLWTNAGAFGGEFGFFLAGLVVWLLIALLCVYTMFLIALSRIGLSILLALGPFFIVMLLFQNTRRLFDAWLAQLANYGLITVLTIMAAALMLQIVDSYATQTVALGSAIVTVDALNMVLAAALVFLLMRQIMPIASALAGGAAFNTFGAVSRVVNWSARAGRSITGLGVKATVWGLRRND